MPFAHQDVLEVRQRWVVCCYKRQNFLSHVLGLFWSRLAFSELTLAPNRSRVSGRVKSNAVVSPTVSIEQVTVPPSQVLCREGTQLLNLITLEWSEKVKYVLINERLSCSCDGFWKPASTIRGIKEYMVQLIAIWSRSVDYSAIYWASRGDGPLAL